MSIVKLNTAAPGGSPTGNNEGGSGLGLLFGIALLGAAIWGAVTYFGKKKEESANQEQGTTQ